MFVALCDAGYYSDSTNCTECPVGSYQEESEFSGDSCMPCAMFNGFNTSTASTASTMSTDCTRMYTTIRGTGYQITHTLEEENIGGRKFYHFHILKP